MIGNTDNYIKNLSLLYSEDLKSIRLAPAYDIVSTMIYESSTENMALSIGGIYNINEITREAFEKTTVQVGIGAKMAMKRFDTMVSGFSDAMNLAKAELKQQGFEQVEQISEQIMKKGVIRKEISRVPEALLKCVKSRNRRKVEILSLLVVCQVMIKLLT